VLFISLFTQSLSVKSNNTRESKIINNKITAPEIIQIGKRASKKNTAVPKKSKQSRKIKKVFPGIIRCAE
jgi:hypothetical protein